MKVHPRSAGNIAKFQEKSHTSPTHCSSCLVTHCHLPHHQYNLAGVAQSVERVALITAKRSTSRSWVRAPPSAIPMSQAQKSSCSFAFLLGGHLGGEGLGEAKFWRVGGLGWLLWPLLRWQPSCFFVPGGKRNLMEQSTCLTLCQLYDHQMEMECCWIAIRVDYPLYDRTDIQKKIGCCANSWHVFAVTDSQNTNLSRPDASQLTD
jgi:hypothetical protein